MPTSKKILIGILTILPGFCFMGYFLFFFGTMFLGVATGHEGAERMHRSMMMMPIAMVMFAVGGVLTVIMTIYHVIHISNSTTMSSNDKLVWILIVLLLNWIGDIIFWYMKIWREEKNDPNKSTFY